MEIDKDIIKDIRDIKWHKIGMWDTPFFQDYIIVAGTRNLHPLRIPIDFSHFLYLKGEASISEDDYTKFYQYHKEKYEKEGLLYFKRLGKVIASFGKKSVAYSDKIRKKDYSEVSALQLKKAIADFCRFTCPNIALGYVIQPLDQLFMEILEEKLSDYLNDKPIIERNRIISVLTIPKRDVLMVMERKELLIISKNVSKNNKLKSLLHDKKPAHVLDIIRKEHSSIHKRLSRHAEKYGWMSNFNWNERPLGIADFLKKISESIGDDADKEIINIKHEKDAIEKEYQKLIRELSSKGIKVKKIC